MREFGASMSEQPGLWDQLRAAPWWVGVLLALGLVVVIAGIASSGGKSRNAPPPNLPAGAVAGKFDGECELGPTNQCTNGDAAKKMKAVETWCIWRGHEVVVHVRLHNGFGAGAKVSVVPRYVIENGGQHGTSFGSEAYKTVRAGGDVVFDINAGHPEGVPAGSTISECKPKLYDVDLQNVP